MVEVRQGALTWIAVEQEEEDDEEDDEEEEAEAGGGRRRQEEDQATNIKSNNPHLAGGEKCEALSIILIRTKCSFIQVVSGQVVGRSLPR